MITKPPVQSNAVTCTCEQNPGGHADSTPRSTEDGVFFDLVLRPIDLEQEVGCGAAGWRLVVLLAYTRGCVCSTAGHASALLEGPPCRQSFAPGVRTPCRQALPANMCAWDMYLESCTSERITAQARHQPRYTLFGDVHRRGLLISSEQGIRYDVGCASVDVMMWLGWCA